MSLDQEREFLQSLARTARPTQQQIVKAPRPEFCPETNQFRSICMECRKVVEDWTPFDPPRWHRVTNRTEGIERLVCSECFERLYPGPWMA